MRIWHEKLITELPAQQLLRLHQECCALRGSEWNKKPSTVDYIFEYPLYKLYQYHMKVLKEMKQREYSYDPLWENPAYRGDTCPMCEEEMKKPPETAPVYPEHDIDYLKKCLAILAEMKIRLMDV